MRHRKLLAAGAGLDLVAVLVCLVAPLYSVDDGSGVSTATLLEANGSGALVPLALFLGLGLLAWLAPWRWLRVALVVAHGLLTVLALFTIGVFFLPAALALAAGALRELLRVPPPPVTAPGPA